MMKETTGADFNLQLNRKTRNCLLRRMVAR